MAPSATPAASTPAPVAKAQKEQKQASRAASDAGVDGDESASVAGSTGSANGNGKKRKRNRGGRKRRGGLANGTHKADIGPDKRDEEEEAAAVVAASKRPRIDLEDLSKSLAITGLSSPSYHPTNLPPPLFVFLVLFRAGGANTVRSRQRRHA